MGDSLCSDTPIISGWLRWKDEIFLLRFQADFLKLYFFIMTIFYFENIFHEILMHKNLQIFHKIFFEVKKIHDEKIFFQKFRLESQEKDLTFPTQPTRTSGSV